MTEHRVIKADFADFRRVKGRKVLQLFLEIPLEDSERALSILGHPKVGESTWCALAVLNEGAPKAEGQTSEASGSSKKWSEYKPSQQCAILCDDEDFQRYIGNPLDAAQWVRAHLDIKSRSELDKEPFKARWDEFLALYRLHQQRHGGLK